MAAKIADLSQATRQRSLLGTIPSKMRLREFSIAQLSSFIDLNLSPVWFYCKTGKHCSLGGMVFSINPTADKTQDAFKAAALASGASASSAAPPAASSSAPAAPNGAVVDGRSAAAVVLSVFGLIAGML